MHQRRILIPIFIFLLTCILLAGTTILLVPSEYGTGVLNNVLDFFTDSYGVDISFESISQPFFGSFSINKIKVEHDGHLIANIPQLKVSTGILNIVRHSVGEKEKPYSVIVSGAEILLSKEDESLIERFTEKETITEQENDENKEKEKKDISFSIEINSFNANISYKNIVLDISDSNASVLLDKGTINSCMLNFKRLSLSNDSIKVSVQNTDIIYNSEKICCNIDSLSIGNDYFAKKIIINALISGKIIIADLFSESINADIDSCKVNASKLNINADFSITDNILSSGLSVSDVTFSSKDANIVTSEIKASLTWNNRAGASFKANVSNIQASCFDINIDSPSAELSAILDDNKTLTLSSSLEAVANTKYSGFEKCNANINVSCSADSISNLRNNEVNVTISGINSPVLKGENTISASLTNLDSANVQIYFESGLKGEATYTVSTKQLYSNFIFSSFKVSDFRDFYAPSTGFLYSFADSNSLINGNINIVLDLSDSFPKGNIGIDITGSNFNFLSKKTNSFVKINLQSDGTIIEIPTFIIGIDTYSVSFKGFAYSENLLPCGRLEINNSNSDSNSKSAEISSIDFYFSDYDSSYSFNIEVPALKNFSIDGHLYTNDRTISKVAVNVNTKQKQYPLELELEYPRKMSGKISAPGMSLSGGLGHNSTIYISGILDNFSIITSKSNNILISAHIDNRYNLATGNLELNSTGFSVSSDNNFAVMSDIYISNHNVSFSNCSLIISGKSIELTGSMTANSDNFALLLKHDFSDIDAVADFTSPDGSYLHLNAKNGDYYVSAENIGKTHASLSLLGTEGNGFVAEILYMDFYTNVIYKNGTITLCDGNGHFEGMNVSSFSFFADFKNRIANASFSIDLKSSNDSGIVHRTFDVKMSASLDSIKITSFKKSGIKGTISFNVSLSNIKMNTFNAPDFDINVLFKDGKFILNGNIVNGFVDINEKKVNLTVDKALGIGAEINGTYSPDLDIVLHNMYIRTELVNEIMKDPVFVIQQGILEGDLLVKGKISSPEFYGMLFCSVFKCSVFFLPDQTLTVHNMAITANGKQITMPYTPLVGYNESNGHFFNGNINAEIILQNSAFEYVNIDIKIGDEGLYLWVPILARKKNGKDINIRGNATGGHVGLRFTPSNPLHLDVDTTISNLVVDFKLPEMPTFFYNMTNAISMSLNIITGKNVEFFFPSVDNAFINFTVSEGENAKVEFSPNSNKIKTSGSLSFKTGRIYYFNNDFYITDGKLNLSEKSFSEDPTGLVFSLDMNAQIKMYDVQGKPIDITLMLNKANLENFTPHFVSTPSKTENEILQILGNAFISTDNEDITISSVASVAASATQVIRKLGLFESNNSGLDISSAIKKSLGLDILSLRSSLISNIIVNALPGKNNVKNISMIARYLDGTSIYAGKNFSDNLFGKVRIQLDADKKRRTTSKSSGRFLADDLILNVNVSLDWKNPMFTFTFFTQPKELSVFNFLDNIGFSVTKAIRYR